MEELSAQPIRLLSAENKSSGRRGDALQQVTFSAAVANLGFEKKIEVHWSGPDGRWRISAARFVRSTGAYEIWEARGAYEAPHGRVDPEQATIEFALQLRTGGGEWWDNNGGANYRLSGSEAQLLAPHLAGGAPNVVDTTEETMVAANQRLKVLTLNLHCFQEENWDAKFWQIAQAINDHEVDVVCLQEVAEPWNQGHGDRLGNAARIIRARLLQHYHLVSDWSHLGFGQYREGSAILSRYDIALKDSGYVSRSRDPYNIHARKVVMAQVKVPTIGRVNVYSTHLSWWQEGFRTQFENLRRWANDRHTPDIAATLLCGDFNAEPSSEGYKVATESGDYEDQFLKAHLKSGLNGDVAAGTDRRIDYIFLKKGSELEAVASKVLFTSEDYGPVSDHPGYYAEFESTA